MEQPTSKIKINPDDAHDIISDYLTDVPSYIHSLLSKLVEALSDAIHQLREKTNELIKAQTEIEQHEKQIQVLKKKLDNNRINRIGNLLHKGDFYKREIYPADIVELFNEVASARNKIRIIKKYRERFDLSVKDTKTLVDIFSIISNEVNTPDEEDLPSPHPDYEKPYDVRDEYGLGSASLSRDTEDEEINDELPF